MPKHRVHPTRRTNNSPSRLERSRCYGIEVLKLDNPGAGTHFFVAEGGHALVQTKEAAVGMTQADAKSLLLSTSLHKLLLSLDGVLESQVMKLR